MQRPTLYLIIVTDPTEVYITKWTYEYKCYYKSNFGHMKTTTFTTFDIWCVTLE